MVLFQLVRKYYHLLGVYPTQLNPNGLFNLRNFCVLLITSALFASTISSFMLQSTTIMDYAESFYMFSTVFAQVIGFLATIWKAEIIFTFINELEEFIQMSKFNRIKHSSTKIKSFPIHFLQHKNRNICRPKLYFHSVN